MIALISPAKTMRAGGKGNTKGVSEPRFIEQTNHIVSQMVSYSSAEIQEIFKISAQMAAELCGRFDNFYDEDSNFIAAVDSYDGVVYKHFKGNSPLSVKHRNYLQKHLRISSLLYGLLRPLDNIKPYRMEGFVRLAGSDERIDKYWRNIQTDTLIDDVNQAGGVLIYLASKEEQSAFNWSKVKKSVRVIDIKFLEEKGGKLRQVVIYTKMARGEMIRYMMEGGITNHEELKKFEWNGYQFSSELSDGDNWVWRL